MYVCVLRWPFQQMISHLNFLATGPSTLSFSCENVQIVEQSWSWAHPHGSICTMDSPSPLPPLLCYVTYLLTMAVNRPPCPLHPVADVILTHW